MIASRHSAALTGQQVLSCASQVPEYFIQKSRGHFGPEKMQLTTATNVRVTVLLRLSSSDDRRKVVKTGLFGRRVIVNLQPVTIAWVAFTSRQENDESPVNDRILRIRVI